MREEKEKASRIDKEKGITTMPTYLDGPIYIVSGEGTGPGTRELYTGKRTQQALRTRLTRERWGSDRWAHIATADGDRLYPEIWQDA